MGKAPLPIE